MSAKHAVLGLLLDRPAYPYQMADLMQRRLGPSWRVNSGSLYNTVKALESDGLIERVHRSPDGRDERHVFAITPRGVREFERWFEQTPDTVRLSRRPLLVKITFAGPERLARTLSKLDEYERDCAERLNAIVGMRDALPGTDEQLLRTDHLLLRLNLSSDVFALEGELRWAQHARELLTWLSEQEGAIWPNGSGGERSPASASARTQLFTRIARAGSDREEHAGEREERPNTPRAQDPAPKRAAG